MQSIISVNTGKRLPGVQLDDRLLVDGNVDLIAARIARDRTAELCAVGGEPCGQIQRLVVLGERLEESVGAALLIDRDLIFGTDERARDLKSL